MKDDPAANGGPQSAAQREIRSIFGNAGLLLGGKGFNAVLSLGYLAFAARALGVEQFGVLVLIHGTAQTISELTRFESWQVILQYGHSPLEQGDTGRLQRLLRFGALLDLLSAGGGALLGVLIVLLGGHLLGWPAHITPQAALYMTSIAFMGATTPVGVLRLLGRFDLLALRSGGGGLSRFIGAAFGWWLDAGLGVFLAVWYLATVISFIGLIGSCWRQLRTRGLIESTAPGPAEPVADLFPGVWRLVLSTSGNLALGALMTRTPILIVGNLLGPSAAAIYRVASQFADGMGKPARTIVQALYPELVRMRARNDWQGLRRVSVRISLICGLVSIGLLLLTAVAGGPVLALVAGQEFRSGSTPLVVLVAATTVAIWALPLEPLLVSSGRATTALGVRVLVTAVHLPLLYGLTLHYGLIGTCAAAVVGAVTLLIVQALPVLGLFRQQP